MKKDLNIITTKREHLFQIMRKLYRALPPSRLEDLAQPVIITVEGTFSSGKKIIPDAALEEFFNYQIGDWKAGLSFKDQICHPTLRFHGTKNYDERWYGKNNGKKLEIGFMNAAYERRAYSPDFQKDFFKKDRVEKFLSLRKHAGISFIHNSRDMVEKPDIKIFLEDYNRSLVTYDDYKAYQANKYLSDAFAKAADVGNWVRFLSINVCNDALLEDKNFSDFYKKMQTRTNDVLPQAANDNEPEAYFRSLMQDKKFEENIPVYDINISSLER